MHDLNDAQLAEALIDLGPVLEPTNVDLWPSLADSVGPRSPWRAGTTRGRPLAAVAVVLVVAATATMAIPQARSAAASLLGIGRTEIKIVDELPAAATTSLPTAGDLTDLRVAADRADIDLVLPPVELVGPVTGWEIRRTGQTSDLIVAFDELSLTLRTLTADTIVNRKLVVTDNDVLYVRLDDDRTAIWIESSHVALRDTIAELTGRVLLWTSATLEYRLANAVDLDAALAVANSTG